MTEMRSARLRRLQGEDGPETTSPKFYAGWTALRTRRKVLRIEKELRWRAPDLCDAQIREIAESLAQGGLVARGGLR